MTDIDVLVAIRRHLPTLTKVERRIADKVLADATAASSLTISQLAQECDTSTASVIRLCRVLGFSGYKEFRLALAASSSREETARQLFRVDDAEIALDDEAADVVAKVAYQESRAIEDTANNLDLEALDAVVAAIRRAPRIDIYGAGSSGLTAQDLHLKLQRIGYPGLCWSDAHLALTSVAITTPDSVAIGISHTGATLETNQLLSLARDRGATTVAITNHPNSALGTLADHVLATSVQESRLRTGAMSSRLAQMAIIDFIIVRLRQDSFEVSGELLETTFRAIQGHRLGSH